MNNTDKDNEQHLNKKVGTNNIRSYLKKLNISTMNYTSS